MQIPPLKQSTFYIVIVLVLIVGIVLGALLIGYAFSKNREKVCLATESPVINTDLTQSQVQNAVSLDSNKMMFGKVVSKYASSFTLQVSITNPLDTKNSTTTVVKIPFDATKDEVIISKQNANTSNVEIIKASFSDIKVGRQILLKIINGKKTVYLTSS